MIRVIRKSIDDVSNRFSILKIVVRNKSSSATSQPINSSEILEKMRNIRSNELVLFNETYNQILTDLNKNPYKCLEYSKVNERLKEVIDYNVLSGKNTLGLSLVLTYHLLSADHDRSDKDMHNARVLGWCLELLQAYFVVLDDIMDNSITRRGQPCWYRKDEVGLMACNDAALLESGMFYLMRLYFHDKPYYGNLLELMLETVRLASYGQCMDLLVNPPVNPPGIKPNLNTYTIDKYSAIVKYKASYPFASSVRLAMYMSNWSSKKDHDAVEKISFKLGHLFQVQDDYIDCFGDSSITGKIGTDIENGKCCWPIVTALQVCNEQQKVLLQQHYGRKDSESVKQVKDIYYQLNLQNLLKEYENNAYVDILQSIDHIRNITDLPSAIFNFPLSLVYGRRK